jgi:glucose-6-phosphate isomerase
MQATQEKTGKGSVIGSPAWKALESHYRKAGKLHLRELFADDSTRGERLTASAAGIELDYSKNRITEKTLQLLFQLATEAGLSERIAAMFSGEKINITENRAVLHTALRAPAGTSIVVDGKNVVPEVHTVLDRMAVFCEQVRSGAWRAIRASASGMSSISGSAAPTSVR